MADPLPIAPSTGTVLPKSQILRDFQIATMEQADEDWLATGAGSIWFFAWPHVQGNQSFRIAIKGGLFGTEGALAVLGFLTPQVWDLSTAQAFALWRHPWAIGTPTTYSMWLRFHSVQPINYGGTTSPETFVGTDVYTILLEKGSDATYIQDTLGSGAESHKGRYFYADKSDFTVTGSPSWANIVNIEIHIFDLKPWDASTVFDDLHAVKNWASSGKAPDAVGASVANPPDDPSGKVQPGSRAWGTSDDAQSGWSPIPPGKQI